MYYDKKRKKVSMACAPCRVRKIRCTGTRPVCEPCQRRHTNCTYDKKTPMKTEGNRTKRSIDMFDGKNQHLVGAQTSNSDDSETHCAGSARWCPGFASSCPESTASGSGSSNITTAPLAEVEDNGKSLQHSLGIIKDGHDSDRYQYPMQAQQRFTAMGLASESRSDTPERGQQFLGDSSVVFFLEQIADPSETDVEKTSSVTTTLCGNINTSTIYSSRTMEPPRLEINSEELPPRQLADHLLNCYFDKIHSLYPFVHKNSFSRAYKLIWSPEYQTSDASFTTGIGLGDPTVSPAMFLCALNVIFALGCQFITLDRSARKAASEKFFQRSQRLQNLTCLDEGNISTVQTLLLASQYLQGVGSPAKCWNLIGLACRMAQGLGLHSDKADKDRLPAELQMRRRIWHGCVMQDLASSMMLGRPPMTHISTVPLPEALDDEYLDFALPPRSQSQSNISRVEFYVRNLQLYEILRKILSRVYGSPVDGNKPAETEEEFERVSTVMELDSELLRFKSGLPEALKWNDMDSPCEVPEQFRRESNLLKARFLHLRVLLLRPQLTEFCRETRDPDSPFHDNSCSQERFSHLDSKMVFDFGLSCSTGCVDAAIELTSLMNTISRTEMASIWWYSIFYTFTAGIVLLYAQMCPMTRAKFSNDTMNSSWTSCLDCLDHMSTYSKIADTCSRSLRATQSHIQFQKQRNATLQSSRICPGPLCQTSPRATISEGQDLFAGPISEIDTSMPSAEVQYTDGFEVLDHMWGGQIVDGSLLAGFWDNYWLNA